MYCRTRIRICMVVIGHPRAEEGASAEPSGRPVCRPYPSREELIPRMICRLTAHHRPVFSLQLSSYNVVVVSTIMCHEVFMELDVTFANRLSLPARQQTLVRVAALQFLPMHRVSYMACFISTEVHAMVHMLYWSATESPPIQLKLRLFELSLCIGLII